MSVIRWLVMQEVCLGLNLLAILNLIWPGHPLLYAHANKTTSDEHSIVTMFHSTRIIFSTDSFIVVLHYSHKRLTADGKNVT